MEAIAWIAAAIACVTVCLIDKGPVFKWATIASVAVAVLAIIGAQFSGEVPSEINASLKSTELALSSAVAKAGGVTFHISNHSTDTKHNFVVYKTDLAGDKLPMDNKGDVMGAQLTKVGEMEVDKGNSRDLKVDLTPGHYVAVSNLDGQYKAGMHVDLTVMP